LPPATLARDVTHARLAVLSTLVGLATIAGMPALASASPRTTPVSPASVSSVIVVTTTVDALIPVDRGCSLRAAILAANHSSTARYGYCGLGTDGTDEIDFALGSGVPAINVDSDLPQITQGVVIDGHTGGAQRVELHGTGAATGLDIISDTPSTIKSMVLDGFGMGIHVGADNTTIKRSVIGPNGTGIEVTSPGAIIGGTNGVTVGGPCTGDCNLISGNSYAGLYLASGGAVVGDFIGTTKDGLAADANGMGIIVSSGTWTIGGPTAAAGNVISGNTGNGLDLHGCTCLIQANLIGTNAKGKLAVANGGTGINGDGLSSTTIGGISNGAGNIISGNGYDGILLTNSIGTTIQGNRIGVSEAGLALGNGADGIELNRTSSSSDHGVRNTLIGSPSTSSAANIIASNKGVGIRITGTSGSKYNEIRRNSIHDNGKATRIPGIHGIVIDSGANEDIVPPSITGTSPISGTACPGCAVDVYSDWVNEGYTYEGTVTADGSGNWSYAAAVGGPHVTATSTDANHNTSEFSAPVSVPSQPDGRIKKGKGKLIGNNIYNATGANQTKSGRAAKGSTITFGISIQNDGGTAAAFTVVATGDATSMYTVKYFRGTTDITAAVIAGTYTTPSLPPGSAILIKAKVKVNSTATAGSSVTRLVAITSQVDSSVLDAVKFVASRK
jgi:CSLREA domain-containing protein